MLNKNVELAENMVINKQNNKATLKSKEENKIQLIQLPQSFLKKFLNGESSSEKTKEKEAKFEEDEESCEKEKNFQKTKSAKKCKCMSVKNIESIFK